MAGEQENRKDGVNTESGGVKLDPWASTTIEDYDDLFEQFGISHFADLLGGISQPHRYMRRKIIFGHRGYDLVAEAMSGGTPFAVMSGFVPSGEQPHFGHKMVMDEIIWHQQQGGDAFFCIADLEGLAARGINLSQGREVGEEYIVSAIALGLEPKEGSRVYYQSGANDVLGLAFRFAAATTFSKARALYGFSDDTNIGKAYATAIQCADINHPQLDEWGGPKPVVIPVGVDQDPHIRYSRDVAEQANLFSINPAREHRPNQYIVAIKQYQDEEHKQLLDKIIEELKSKGILGDVERGQFHFYISQGAVEMVSNYIREFALKHGKFSFVPPASTYHKFMTGLTGGKMSSSVPDSVIQLTEPPGDAAAKVLRAKTGGKVSLEEQKRDGGNPDECAVYELLMFHLVEDDGELTEIYLKCRQGERLCGKCKKDAAERLEKFLVEHQQLREQAREMIKELDVVWPRT